MLLPIPGSDVNFEDLAALEAFVAENDDLLELEERIGRFNIFDALGITRAEIRHSNFLGWLLDPSESHGQGDLFLKAVLADVFREARRQGIEPPTNLIELDGGDLGACEVRREWQHVDLLLVDREHRFVIAIENKVDSGEHSGQLDRYERAVKQEFADYKRLHVFLTPDGAEASDEDWVTYSYRRLHHVLARLRRTGAGAIGEDVGVFLGHYMNLLETRLMEDMNLGELCRKIYANHRRAIDLVIAHAGSTASPIFQEIERIIKARSGRWHYYRTGTKTVDFTYLPLLTITAQSREKLGLDSWLNMNFNLWTTEALSCNVWVWDCDDMDRRKRVLERITRDRAEFGLRLTRKGQASTKWASLGRKPLVRWVDDEPDIEAITKAVGKQLDEWEGVFDRMVEAIKQVP